MVDVNFGDEQFGKAEQLAAVLDRIKAKLTRREQAAVSEATAAQHVRLPEGYEHATWDRVNQPDRIQAAVKTVWQERRFPLYIHGPTGTGKSCLAALVFSMLHQMPMWRRADEFLIDIATKRNDGWPALKEKIRHSPCLFLDDLGLRPPTESMFHALFDVMELRANRPLVICSNKTLSQLAALYDDRIISRLSAGTQLLIDGEDRRKATGRKIRV